MIKPLPGFVLIEALDDEEVTASGLALPEKAKEKPAKGKVIAKGAYMKGQNEWLVLWDAVHEDDQVVFHRWAGQDVKYGQKEYKLVKFSDLLGIYE